MSAVVAVAKNETKFEAPRVSICTSVLNQSEWLRESIQSVVAQTYPNWELIVVDDGSTEDIKAVVESFDDRRIRYFRFAENRGIPHGANFALSQALGEFVGLLAADEIISPRKLEEQLAFMDANPKVDCVWGIPGRGPFGLRPEWEQNVQRAHNRSREAWLRTLLNLEGVPIGGASFLMRRAVMDSLGRLDDKLTIFSDHELYCRFFEKHVGVILPYRWAVDRVATENSVRHRNNDKVPAELAYVQAKHPMPSLPVTGKVTVGIPCHNMAQYLPQAVESVLKQTYQDFEIFILDDGSTDNFKEVIAGFSDPRIRVFGFDENRGYQEAMNQLAFRANGEFFVVLSADDTIETNYLERCLAEFATHPWAEFVATQTDFMNKDGVKYELLPDDKVESLPLADRHAQMCMRIVKPTNRTREQWLESLYNGNQYFGVGMYRTYAVSEVGGWEKEYKVISDYQMYLKLLNRENIRIIEEPLTHTRVHGTNHSLLNKSRHDELPSLYHKARKPFYRPLMKVVIATPFYELKGFSPYIDSLVATTRLLTAVGIDWQFMQLSGDSYVHRARNTICDQFLRDQDATDLFFVDSDMSWNPEAFVKMCMLPDDVVGGSYPVKNQWQNWTSVPQPYFEEGKQVMRGRPLGDGTALIDAYVLAGGFLRIKRHVLEQYRDHYTDLWYKEPSTRKDEPDHKYTAFFQAESIDNKFFGEDHMFSRRLRDMGVKMFIFPDAEITHWGYKDFTGNYDRYLKGKSREKDAVKVMEVEEERNKAEIALAEDLARERKGLQFSPAAGAIQ